MTNREWLLNKMQSMSDEELAEIFSEGSYLCRLRNCEETTNTPCKDCELNWLKAEHKEKITLSEAERVILENIDKDYKWIARDKDNSLWLYGDRPIKKSACWSNEYSEIGEEFAFYKHLFQFITWQDDEPYNIEELLEENK